MALEVKELEESSVRNFVNLPYALFWNDPFWTGELIDSTHHTLSPAHPFWLHGERTLFMAYQDGRPVGRIAAIINRAHNSFHGENCGFFGFFDCENNAEIAKALLTKAEDFLRSKGMDKIVGPVNPSTNETCGMLIDAFDLPPMIMMPYNPPYYPNFMEAACYTKAKDLFAFRIDPNKGLPERYTKLLDRIMRSNKIKIHKVNVKELESEIAKLKNIYNTAWEKNWGFVPMSGEEINELAHSIKPILKPDFLYFATYENEPAGFVLILPNLNPAFKAVSGKITVLNFLKFILAAKSTKNGRLLTLGVKKEFRNKGIELALIKQAMDTGAKLKWQWGEMSWTLEDNEQINKTITSVGGEKYKTYRLYTKKL